MQYDHAIQFFARYGGVCQHVSRLIEIPPTEAQLNAAMWYAIEHASEHDYTEKDAREAANTIRQHHAWEQLEPDA